MQRLQVKRRRTTQTLFTGSVSRSSMQPAQFEKQQKKKWKYEVL
jgi:hypothetical protein